MIATAEAAAAQARAFMTLADKLRAGKMTLATVTTLLDESIAYLDDLLGEIDFLLAAANDDKVIARTETPGTWDCGCCDETVTGFGAFCQDCVRQGCDQVRAHPDSTPDPETGRIPESAGTGPEIIKPPGTGDDADLVTFAALTRDELDVLAYSLTSGWKKQSRVWPVLCEAWWDTRDLIHDSNMTMQAASQAAMVPPDPELPADLPAAAISILCGLASPDDPHRVCSAQDGHPEPWHALHGAQGRVVMYWPVTEAPDEPVRRDGLVAGDDGFVPRPLQMIAGGEG